MPIDPEIEEFIDDLLKSLEESYQEMLTQESLKDAYVIRVGFYQATLNVMREEPLEDDEEGLQELLENRIQALLIENLNEFNHEIAATITPQHQ